jgi:outer membrane protein TolC
VKGRSILVSFIVATAFSVASVFAQEECAVTRHRDLPYPAATPQIPPDAAQKQQNPAAQNPPQNQTPTRTQSSLTPPPNPQPPQPTRPGKVQNLSLQQAEQIALQNHPQIQAAMNLAEAARAQATQSRSPYYPTISSSYTRVDAENNSRFAAGLLNNPSVFQRYANGVSVSQLISDFGRTRKTW